VAAHTGYSHAVFVLVALVFLAFFLLHRLVLGYPRPEEPYQVIGASDAAFLNAAAETLFPANAALPLDGRQADLPGYVDRYLASLPRRQRALIRMLFLLFEQSTLVLPAQGVGAFRRFSSLDPEQRETVLRGWDESRAYPRRLAFTALKAILIMGYFGHPETLRSLSLEPFEFETPICEADLLYPPIGKHPDAIEYSEQDLTPPSDGSPLMRAELPR
jgi:hypothetical protein